MASPDETACPACGAVLRPWQRIPASDPVLTGALYTLLRRLPRFAALAEFLAGRAHRGGTVAVLARRPEGD